MRTRRTRPVALLMMLALVLSLALPASGKAQIFAGTQAPRTMLDDARTAAMAYADKRVQDAIQKQSKKAIIKLYRKLYRSGADKRLVRALGEVALSAKELDALTRAGAEAWATGDPDKVQDAAGQFSILLGKQLTRGLSDPQLRMGMMKLLDSPDKVNRLAEVIGTAAGGDPKAAQAYIGRALIALTPGANVFAAFESASTVMRYAHGKFTDAQIEDLYQQFAGGRSEEEIREMLSGRVYTYIVGDYRRRLQAEREESIRLASGAVGPELQARLTRATETEVIEQIVSNFASRLLSQRKEEAIAEIRAKAQAEVDLIIEQLDVVSFRRYGANWWEERPRNLERFVLMVRERLERDRVFDPDDPRDIRAMAYLLATGIVYGRDSDEYCEERKNVARIRLVIQGVNPIPEDRIAALCGSGRPDQMRLAGFSVDMDHLHHAGGWLPQIVEQRDGHVVIRVDRPEHPQGLHCFVDLVWAPPSPGDERFELEITIRPYHGDGEPWTRERPHYQVDLGFNGGAEPGAADGPLVRRRGHLRSRSLMAFQPTRVAVVLDSLPLHESVRNFEGARTSIRVVPRNICGGDTRDSNRRFVAALNYAHQAMD